MFIRHKHSGYKCKLAAQNMVNSMQNAHFGMQNAHFGGDKIGEPRSKEKCKVVQNAPKDANLDRI